MVGSRRALLFPPPPSALGHADHFHTPRKLQSAAIVQTIVETYCNIVTHASLLHTPRDTGEELLQVYLIDVLVSFLVQLRSARGERNISV